MRRTRIPLRAISLLFGGMSVVASTIPASQLFGRLEASQCSTANWERCPQSAENDWPNDFCCEKGSSCLSNAGNTTLICCPPNSNCAIITPMTCLMDLYNAQTHADGMVKTTALNGILPPCGTDTCCPFGYHCATDKSGAPACFRDKDQNPAPITTTPAKPSATTTGSSSSSSTGSGSTTAGAAQSTRIAPSSTSSSPTSTSTPGQNNGASSGADTNPTLTPEAGPGGPPTSVIAGASVGAVLLVAAVAFIAFVFFKRRHRKQAEEAEQALKLHPRSTSSFGNIISNPIVAANTTMRSDFVRKSPGGGGGGRRSSIGSGFSVSTLTEDDGAVVPPMTPSPVRMREGVGTTARIPPIRNMAQARQSSIAYGVGAPETSPYSNGGGGGAYHQVTVNDGSGGAVPYPVTPRQGGGGAYIQEREPSSISINVFADPRIATPQRAEVLSVPETPDMGRNSHLTTFSDMMRVADLGDVAQGRPFVPGSQNGTPSSRSR